jgi:hypothetical protein
MPIGFVWFPSGQVIEGEKTYLCTYNCVYSIFLGTERNRYTVFICGHSFPTVFRHVSLGLPLIVIVDRQCFDADTDPIRLRMRLLYPKTRQSNI